MLREAGGPRTWVAGTGSTSAADGELPFGQWRPRQRASTILEGGMDDETAGRRMAKRPATRRRADVGRTPDAAAQALRRGSVMHDVARLAGVSHQTVSRVLNDHPNVRPETRSRVLEAMRVLNYRRNLAARTLVTRRSRTLGLVAFETTLFGPASMLYGIEQAARAAGYFVTIASYRTLDCESVLEAIDRLC